MGQIDYLVVGAGTAGCVVASRLSEDPDRRVLLLEAGPDFPDAASMPESMRRGSPPGDSTGYDWALESIVCGSRRAPLARGRLVGGSGQINGAGAWRALAADFERWTDVGVRGWGWDDVKGAYCAVEHDLDFGDLTHHGRGGPVPITRYNDRQLPAPMEGFLRAVTDMGQREVADMNAPDAVGIGRYPQNRSGDLRVSTNLSHLAAARSRTNLTVCADVTVDAVEIRNGRAVGVRVGQDVIEASMTILAAGTPLSPALLLRSGVGPAADLRRLGIPVVADRPGVGYGLYDQPGAVVPARPVVGVSSAGPGPRVVGRLADTAELRLGDATYLSLFINPAPGEAETMCAIMVGDLDRRSRGTIRLHDASPFTSPEVDLAFYSAEGDLDRMRQAYRYAWELAHHPVYERHITEILGITDDVVGDDERLDGHLQEMTFSRGALLGGAAMGPSNNAMAVVDENCYVHDVNDLKVVDLSMVPVALRSPTALDATALAEHAAQLIIEQA